MKIFKTNLLKDAGCKVTKKLTILSPSPCVYKTEYRYELSDVNHLFGLSSGKMIPKKYLSFQHLSFCVILVRFFKEIKIKIIFSFFFTILLNCNISSKSCFFPEFICVNVSIRTI